MDKIIDEIIKSLEEVKNRPYINSMDIGDLGNEIGIVLGKHLKDSDAKSSLHFGIDHGIDLSSIIKGGKDGS